MDEFEKRLKRDADAIEAAVSPELKARIDASLQSVEPVRQARRQPAAVRLWWASSLTGLAAALIVIVLVNWSRPGEDVSPVETTAALPTEVEMRTEPAIPIGPEMLDIRTADFTSPLEEELINLRSDFEKARESVAEDLDFTF